MILRLVIQILVSNKEYLVLDLWLTFHCSFKQQNIRPYKIKMNEHQKSYIWLY